MLVTIKVPNLRSESLGNALAAKVQSLAEPAGAKVRASTLPAALRFGLACVQHAAHSAQHTAHSAQRTAHSASCQYAAHMQWILLQGTKFGALKGGSTAYVQHIPREGKSAQRTAHSAQHTAHSAPRTAHSAQRTAVKKGFPQLLPKKHHF